MLYAQASHLHPQKEHVVLYRVHNQLIYVHKRHECVVLYSGSAKHNFRTPTHITYCPQIQGRRLQYWYRWRSRRFASFFVYVIQMYVCGVYEIK